MMKLKLTSTKQLGVIVVVALFGAVGVYILGGARAAITNPPFAYTCGFNVMFQIDNSTSRSSELVNLDKEHIKAFMNAFNGTNTHFLLSLSGPGVMVPYTSDKSKIVDILDRSPGEDGGAVVIGGSDDINLNVLTGYASYRPSKQTIIMIFTDGGDPNKYEDEYDEPSNQLKASGARIIAFVLPGGKVNLIDVQKMTGPNMDTGNILTSDVVYNSDYASLTAQLKRFASIDSCNPPPGSNPGGPGGSSRPGNGSGNNGNGTGSGGGGGGSSANKNDDKPNSIPSSGGQGNNKQPELEPSPFYDGKQYAPGSDALDKAFGNISVAGRTVIHGWTYLLVALALSAGIGGGYWWWRKRGKSVR